MHSAWTLLTWMRSAISTDQLMTTFQRSRGLVVEAASLLRSSTLQGRLMGDMASRLRSINRIEAIRETSFVPLVYSLANSGTALLCGGLVFAVATNNREAFFFLCVIAFLLIFLLHLISDLDNPFGEGDRNSAEDIRLLVLEQALQRPEGHGSPFHHPTLQ